LEQRCQSIELILSDVDGVLTDGGIFLDSQGVEAKRFHIRDGMGIKLWQKAGYKFGLITGRSSHMVKVRAAELGIDIIRQGIDEKLAAVKQVLHELRATPKNVCYVGDDLPDLPPLRMAGLGVAPADACIELREAAHFVTQARGGDGAIRETIEMILKAQRHWSDVIHNFTGK
jgi:YrbI family 3-deoxy-D-manno-octulosonate 8-phosphate phosphatase